MKILVTGAAGFIGNQVAYKLLERGDTVVGIDVLTTYYSVKLKKARLARLNSFDNFKEYCEDIGNATALEDIFQRENPDRVINLAAQAGVRHSLIKPRDYVESNISGFLNILECCRHFGVDHLVYASSSSVYGGNTKLPFSEKSSVDHPKSLYAATKKANEVMAHSYAHLFNFPCTGLRFFTVYGPWGRPDMALFKFIEAMRAGEAIDVYNNGDMLRDFTYIDDIVEGVIRVLDSPSQIDSSWASDYPNPATSGIAAHRIFNIGNNSPVKLTRYIEVLEDQLGIKAIKNMLPLQPGDVIRSWADVSLLEKDFGYKPTTSVETGIANFVSWHTEYYKD